MKKQKRAGKPLPLRYVLQFYDAYSRSKNIAKVAAALETTGPNLQNQIDKHPSLQLAKEIADSYRPFQTLPGYVFSSLSKDAQETWKQITQADSREAVQRIFSRKTKELRQELFIYALVSSCYDLSSACRLVAMDRVQLQKWKHDLHFLQLMEEIQWHKKNFFESSLIGLVEERHPGAVIFVNKTLNADRGYSEKIQVEHSGQINTGFTIEDLDLDLDTRKKILEAIRRKKASTPRQLNPPPTITLETEEAA